MDLLSPTPNAPYFKTKIWSLCYQTHSPTLSLTWDFLFSVHNNFPSCLGSPNYKARCATAAHCCRLPHHWLIGNWGSNLRFCSMWPRHHLQFVAIHSNESSFYAVLSCLEPWISKSKHIKWTVLSSQIFWVWFPKERWGTIEFSVPFILLFLSLSGMWPVYHT